MLIKRLFSTLFLIPIFLFILSKPHYAWNDSNYTWNDSKSGYNTTTHVVDTKTLFTRHRFVEADFGRWLGLVYQAQAYELFNGLIVSGRLSKNGLVQQTPLLLGKASFGVGTGVTVEDVYDALTPTFDAKAILTALQQVQVLDSTAFMIGVTDNVTIYFDAYNFSALFPKLRKLTLPVQSAAAREELINELYTLISGKHRTLEVATQETTRYQSRNDNIFTGLLESMGGNFLGSIFMPDRVKVSQQDYVYMPRVNIASLYPHCLGFSPYPYFDRRSGLWMLNGDKTNTHLTVQLGSLNDIDISNTQLAYKVTPLDTMVGTLFPFFQIGAHYGEVVMPDAALRQGGLSIGGGGSSPNGLSSYTLGLDYQKYSSSAALAFTMRFESAWFVMSPLSLGLEGGLSISGIWQDYDLLGGLYLHFAHARLGVGYKYYNYGPLGQKLEASGIVYGATWYF